IAFLLQPACSLTIFSMSTVYTKVSIISLNATEPYRAQVRELGFLVRKNDLNDTDPLADRDNRIIEVRITP
uniref:hypothetical protein n=1 Tax=Nitrosomonas sp. TaxID=42353 RepID=UPI00374DB641